MDLLKKDWNSKINEVKDTILSISGLAANPALTAVENKIPDVSNLVKKTDYIQKISDTEKKVTDHDHDKSITTSEFNNLTAKSFAVRLAQVNLVTKTDFDTKLINLNINSNKTKHVLVENELKKCKHLIQAILEVKVILKKMVHKII